MATYSQAVAPRYWAAAAGAVSQAVAPRYGSSNQISQAVAPRYSTNTIRAAVAPRYSSRRTVTATKPVRYASVTEDFFAAISGTDPDACYCLEVDLQVDVAGTLHDLTGIPSLLIEEMRESEPTKWQLPIQDDTGRYHPEKAGGDWEGILNEEAFGADGQIAKRLLANVSFAGSSFQLVGVPTDWGHQRSLATGGWFDFAWSGIDISRKLFLPGSTLPTLRSVSDGTIWTTKAAVANLLDAVGIKYDLSRMEDARIRVQFRQDGRAGDWFQQLMNVLWTEWIVIGDTIHCYQPQYEGEPTWVYDNATVVLEDSTQRSAPEVVNSVTMRRASETRRAGGQIIPVNDFKQYPVSFNPPMNYVSWRILKGDGGVLSNIIMKNEAGQIVAVRNAREGSSFVPSALTAVPLNIAQVVFTWGAPAGVLSSGFPGEIEFFGDPPPPNGEAYDPTFHVTRTDPVSIAKHGLHHREFSPNPLIYDSATLERHADGYLIRNSGRMKPQSFLVEYNPLMRPGQLVRVHDYTLGIAPLRYIKGVTRQTSDEPAERFCRMDTIRLV